MVHRGNLAQTRLPRFVARGLRGDVLLAGHAGLDAPACPRSRRHVHEVALQAEQRRVRPVGPLALRHLHRELEPAALVRLDLRDGEDVVVLVRPVRVLEIVRLDDVLPARLAAVEGPAVGDRQEAERLRGLVADVSVHGHITAVADVRALDREVDRHVRGCLGGAGCCSSCENRCEQNCDGQGDAAGHAGSPSG